MNNESWVQVYYRPILAWSYMAVCVFDFMVGPIIFNTLQYLEEGTTISMWQSITLQGGGLYHLSMGAIIGVSAFGRTKEKLAALGKE